MYEAILMFMLSGGPSLVPYGEADTYKECMELAQSHKLRLEAACDAPYEIIPFCKSKEQE